MNAETALALAKSFTKKQHVYSTEETVVGTWIDGKPIYRQIMSGICPATTADGTFRAATYSIGCEVDHLVAMHGWVINNLSNPEHIPFPYITNSGGGFAKCGMTTVSGDSKAWVGTNLVAAKTFPWYLCIEYTKTTDTATIAIPTAAAMMAAYEEGVQEA